ncbi:SDR family NAD(P)-dependent oxidoreductase [Streptomyces sp. VRA16 Mangrove soil]|uniref:SDR family NAD(P)-dependent oxidoreductase n=1 Tax=Streptomyces sp. VRA16 Mangrove soil TaxID=2817434 RepID=UPI001A9E1934|nr:SDR family NAD(P)-dependent oxidoreductase [Streptomyces sp. VRA16 Mangrove soil]MBO1331153.1 SDR family NAD(P)-dependent oxidoreductase [Streptomyces sp. VRA16 Mangrove soil]
MPDTSPDTRTASRTVLITGATGGVGRPLARRLLQDGWRVHTAYRRPADAEELAAEGFLPVALDLTDEESVTAAADTVGPRLDALVNCAGIVVQGPLELVPGPELRRQLDVNVLGQLSVTRAVLPALRASGGGRIVNVGAVTSLVSVPFAGPVAASKAAFASLNDALRMELRPQGVTVSLVLPGAMDTEVFAKADKAMADVGWVGSPGTQHHYARALEEFRKASARMKPGPVAPAVDAIHKALTARRPAARYITGRDGRAVAALRFLPTGLRDGLLSRAVGLGPKAFAPK